MNAFYDHHKDSISWHYRCFDRILLNGLIQPFQQPERVLGVFNTYRQLYPVTRNTLRTIAEQFQLSIKGRARSETSASWRHRKGVVMTSSTLTSKVPNLMPSSLS